ncbi:dehydrogenase/reductase SDR family member 4-like [Mytilus edulis]|uniref:dehydrogenase/reductase SDR family member 4-like n=1 Tax=Mytilus edulis TaxID=6550 RepID=UPI0039F14D02
MFSRLSRQIAVRMSTTAARAQKLKGKVAIVTASTEGIGFAIARRLGEDGAKVVVSSRKQKNVDKAVDVLKKENLDVCGIVCHVGKKDDRTKLIQKTIDEYGGIDILVSNAAANPTMGPLINCSEDAWDKLFDTNVKATFMLCKEIVPHIEKRGGGSIVIVSSIAGYVSSDAIPAYAVTKTALLGLVKGLVGSLAPKNIRVNGIAPGLIDTKFSAALTGNPEMLKMALPAIPLHRPGIPVECSGIVSFLSSEDASYITGENIVISGGMPSRL